MTGSSLPDGVYTVVPTPFTADGRSVDEDALRRVVRHVVEEAKLGCLVQKSESVDRMIELGVLRTPAVAFDGKVVLSGHIPKSEEVKQLLGLA